MHHSALLTTIVLALSAIVVQTETPSAGPHHLDPLCADQNWTNIATRDPVALDLCASNRSREHTGASLPAASRVAQLWTELVSSRPRDTFHRRTPTLPNRRDLWAPSLGGNDEHLNAILNDSLRRRKVDESIYGLVRRHYLPTDSVPILRCQSESIYRVRSRSTGLHKFFVGLCRQQPLCPLCGPNHFRQVFDYQVSKFASVHPSPDALSVAHTVFTLPPWLVRLVFQHPAGLKAWRQSCFYTIAFALGLKTEESARRTIGLALNLHPWGETPRTWLKFQPHFDTLLNGHLLTADGPQPIRPRMPKLYDHVREEYRAQLRKRLSPLGNWFDQSNLKGEFPVDLHIVQGRERDWIATNDHAAAIIRYSCRNHFDLARMQLIRPEGTDVLEYEPYGHGPHCSMPAREAMKRFYSVKHLFADAERTAWMGYLSKNQYSKSAAAFGHAPIRHRGSSEWQKVARYDRRDDGTWNSSLSLNRPPPE